jgi:hypothetical protein
VISGSGRSTTFDYSSHRAPGAHSVRLRRPFARFLRSSEFQIIVEPGKAVEFGSSLLSYLIAGVPELHLATPRESARIREHPRDLPSPRNLRAGSSP